MEIVVNLIVSRGLKNFRVATTIQNLQPRMLDVETIK